MRPNVLIALSLAALAVASPAKSDVRAATSATPVPTATESGAHWKSTPEDPSPWRREPFKKPELESKGSTVTRQGIQETAGELSLQGILKSSRNYYAIINGRTVKTGERIDGWTISGITRHNVTVSRNNEKQVYDIFQGRIDRGSR